MDEAVYNLARFDVFTGVKQGLAEADAMTQAFHAPMLLVYFLRLLFAPASNLLPKLYRRYPFSCF